MWVIGQNDNIGDSTLRRALLEAIRAEHRTLHVAVPRSTPEYINGLSLSPSDRVYVSAKDWRASLVSSRRPSLVLNAGQTNPPITYRPDTRVSILVRRRGGVVLHTGVGIKTPTARPITLLRQPTLLLSNLVYWRDQVSRDCGGIGHVAPDWAFALGTPAADWIPRDQRKTLVVTLRGDRDPPPDDWFERVRQLSADHDLSIVALAQVGLDFNRACFLADRLNAPLLPWPGDLEVAYRSVRAVYAKARAVISDRVHALILGATEGALPLGSTQLPEKALRTLQPAGLDGGTTTHAEFGEKQQTFLRVDIAGLLTDARDRLIELTGRMNALLDQAR